MRIELPNRFVPRHYQMPFMAYLDQHSKGGRAVWVMPRRAGKDLTAMHQTCKMAHQRKGTYWHVYPTAEQGRRSIWTEFTKDGDRIMEMVFPKAIRNKPAEWAPNAEMVVELKCGSIWRLMGSDKLEVVGAGPVGVVFSEYALAKPMTWDFVRPMVREREGWVAFISTPRGKNHLWKEWEIAGREPGYWRDLKTIYETQHLDPDKTLAEERAAGMPEALLRQEYLCDWTAANVGSVYGELLEALEKGGAVSEFDMDVPRVFTTWDLGGSGAKGDATAIWIWSATREGVDLIDYLEGTGKPLSHYHDEVDRRLSALHLTAICHWLPFDATSMHLSGESVLQQTSDRWGQSRVALTPRRNLLDGIQAGRWLLQRKVRIHPRCLAGVEALKAYHYEWDPERKVFSNTPTHDWSSHGADAFRYLACVARYSEEVTRPPDPKNLRPTLNDLVEDYRREQRRKAAR